MPAVLLTGGRATSKRKFSTKQRRKKAVSVPKIRSRSGKRSGVRKRSSISVPVSGTASASERAALQNLAQRLQRGNYTAWRSADPSVAASEAAKAAAASGAAAYVRDLTTGTAAEAVPLTGTGRRRRTGARRSMRGGFFPALIPLIAAAIGAIPGIAGTAVGIASLKEQQRQFNKLYGNK
ncbi:pX protein [Fowl adenovirus]|nr:pX protein [Fowl adenovirus]